MKLKKKYKKIAIQAFLIVVFLVSVVTSFFATFGAAFALLAMTDPAHFTVSFSTKFADGGLVFLGPGWFFCASISLALCSNLVVHESFQGFRRLG